MKIKVLSSYKLDDEKNYGDCLIIDTGKQLIIYDCGSEEFAHEVIKYMNSHGYEKADVVLSHNDADHYNGIGVLVNEKKVNTITTLLLLKYVDDILKRIDDDRKTRESLKRQIKELYDNINELSGNNLKDALDSELYLSDNVKIVGPDLDYALDAVAKQLDTTEGDTIDGETIMNAISIQLEINMNGKKVLLTGDANYEAIKDKIRDYDCIQLPHHGKKKHADDIFEKNSGRNKVIYLVSDNTGNTNGGSDDLKMTGHIIKNTKYGEINLDEQSLSITSKGTLMSNEIHYIKKNQLQRNKK